MWKEKATNFWKYTKQYISNIQPTNSYAKKKNLFQCNNPLEIKTAQYSMFINIWVFLCLLKNQKKKEKKNELGNIKEVIRFKK